MNILLHSSKTMKAPIASDYPYTTDPYFINEASQLIKSLAFMNTKELQKYMNVSDKKALEVKRMYANLSQRKIDLSPAALTFRGDIYSGLQAASWDNDTQATAQQRLFIVSGLYGLLRPFDLVAPYRLEMGYRIPLGEYQNLYEFWGDKLSDYLDKSALYVNLTSEEYSRPLKKLLNQASVITPKFYTYNQDKRQPVFLVVHAKIARGAFAGWLLKNNIQDSKNVSAFSDLGYSYDPSASSETEPVFICQNFAGLGLSTRLS